MNRRELFRGAGVSLLGVLAVKLGIRAPKVFPIKFDSDDPPDTATFDKVYGGVVYNEDPMFDMVTVSYTSDGKTVQVPRLRSPAKAYFVGEDGSIL